MGHCPPLFWELVDLWSLCLSFSITACRQGGGRGKLLLWTAVPIHLFLKNSEHILLGLDNGDSFVLGHVSLKFWHRRRGWTGGDSEFWLRLRSQRTNWMSAVDLQESWTYCPFNRGVCYELWRGGTGKLMQDSLKLSTTDRSRCLTNIQAEVLEGLASAEIIGRLHWIFIIRI